MKFLLALALLAASPAFAKGSSHPQSGSEGGSVMDAAIVPRALIWENSRLWQTTEGTILVCPHEFKIAFRQWEENECYNDKVKGEAKQARWMSLQDYKITGMVLKSYEYRFLGSGGTKTLIAYYGPAAPTVATPKEPSITLTGPITINANRVIVQRKKQ